MKWEVMGTISEAWILIIEADNEEEAIRLASRQAREDNPSFSVDVESVKPIEEES